jgi:hypothetical protein
MKRRGSALDPELEAFLERRKIERQAPAELRARALARARAFLAGDVIPAARPADATPMVRTRGRRLFRIALAASFAIAGAAVGAVAARHDRSADVPPIASPERVAPAPIGRVTNAGIPSTDGPTPPLARVPLKAPRPTHVGARGGSAPDPFTAELELLQRAHGAYTRHDFSVALTLVAEHARRFPSGHLAEQREALRVRSLAGAGRGDEARRAAAGFALRFPRSVLLPQVAGGAESLQP